MVIATAALARIRGSHVIERARTEVGTELRYYVDELEQRLDALEQLSAKRRRAESAPLTTATTSTSTVCASIRSGPRARLPHATP